MSDKLIRAVEALASKYETESGETMFLGDVASELRALLVEAQSEEPRVTPFDNHESLAQTLHDMGWSSPCDAQWEHLRDWCVEMRSQWLAARPVEAHAEAGDTHPDVDVIRLQGFDDGYTKGFEEGCADAYKHLRARPSEEGRWIPVSERLPGCSNPKDENEGWQVFSPGTSRKIWTCWIHPKWWFCDVGSSQEITHWMPLPEAPDAALARGKEVDPTIMSKYIDHKDNLD